MLKLLINNRAQAVMGEYAVVIFLVISTIVGMTVYFKRGLQARIHDARDYMIGEVRTRTAGDFNGVLYLEYEPYYQNTDAVAASAIDRRKELLPGGSTGIFRKNIIDSRAINVNSETLPPRDYVRPEDY